jgi:hypothetical protein
MSEFLIGGGLDRVIGVGGAQARRGQQRRRCSAAAVQAPAARLLTG